MLYLQTCLIGIAILMIPMLSRFHGHNDDWRVFRSMLVVTMADLIFETATWLLNGQTGAGMHFLIYTVNLLTILLQPVIGILWLQYVVIRLGIGARHRLWYRVIAFLPLVLNSLMLLANHSTRFVFEIVNGLFTKGSLFWINVTISFAYPIIATIIALNSARNEKIGVKRREDVTLAAFLIAPVCCAIIQLLYYGTFLFLIGFAISLLIIFVNIQNDQITMDFLTKTYNRASLMYEFERRIKRIGEKCSLFLFMIDVDHFKAFNDEYGHVIGDRVLIDVAERLKRACNQDTCFLARLGGDEFGILLLCERESDAEDLADNIAARFDAGAQKSDLRMPITISLGYTKCLSRNESIDQMIFRADKMMYACKKRRANAALQAQKRAPDDSSDTTAV